MTDITIQYFDDCPNWRTLEERLVELAARREDVTIGYEVVDTPEKAEQVGFRGSPSLLVNGVDPFANPDDPIGLACRVYRTPSGYAPAPSLEQLEAVLSGS